MRLRGTLAPIAAALLAGCASLDATAPSADGWQPVSLPGKTPTRYVWTTKDGRAALSAQSVRSASLWRRKVDLAPESLGEVSFSWWVDHLVDGASVGDAELEDAAARVLFAFDGDESRLPARTRAMFDLVEALTGERPPYATLMYVYESAAPVGSVIPGPRSDRIRKIVLDSGPAELQRWRDHRRDLVADFRLAFGEAPGRLRGVAVMTDSDNTGARAHTWYIPPRLP